METIGTGTGAGPGADTDTDKPKPAFLRGHSDEDYLTVYTAFFDKFSDTEECQDQLPLKVPNFPVSQEELPAEILSYIIQYLDQNECPSDLITPLCIEILEDAKKCCADDPESFGYTPSKSSYTPLKLMRAVVARVNNALRLRSDNSLIANLTPPRISPRAVASATRNKRRYMEDRHIVIEDIDSLFGIQSSGLANFYAVYDGHNGPAAAAYTLTHLHYHFVKNQYYLTNPQKAMHEAFRHIDEQFSIKKSAGGTTAVVCYLRDKYLLTGWVGDSKALLVVDAHLKELVDPHKPMKKEEHTRITELGGCVTFDGLWRVNGITAVSRSLGDISIKPFVSAEPEFTALKLSGQEDFLVLACDGLWDYVSEDLVALEVYKAIKSDPDDIKKVSQKLVQLAKEKKSDDNISIIVVFLQSPHKLAEKASRLLKQYAAMDTSFENAEGEHTNNHFHAVPPQESSFGKEGLLFDLSEEYNKQNGSQDVAAATSFGGSNPFFEEPATNGKRSSDHFQEEEDEDEDFGPETDVDAVDDAILSPSIAAAKALIEGAVGEPESFPISPDAVKPFDTGFDDNRFRGNFVADNFDGDFSRETFDSDFGGDSHNFEGQTDSSLEHQAEVRDTPTPPIDIAAAHGGPADNVGESGEESDEDEWNYFKGGSEKAEDIPESVPENERKLLEDIDNLDSEIKDTMNSPLNPDAAPFVPHTPTRNHEASALPPHFTRENILSQSPVKSQAADDIDEIDVDNIEDFQRQLDTKPKDLGVDEFANGHSDNSALSSQENLKEALQGNEKNQPGYDYCEDDAVEESVPQVNEVDPSEFDRVQKDTMDFCDIRVAYTSNDQTVEPEGVDEELFERLKNKERDPMSMSFYQEKDEDTSEITSNPFDIAVTKDSGAENVDMEYSNEPNFIDEFERSVPAKIDSVMEMDLDLIGGAEVTTSSRAAESPIVEKADLEFPETRDLQSASSNISLLTEPSENIDNPEVQIETEPVVSHDSAISPEAPSPIPSPFEPDEDICRLSKSPNPVLQTEMINEELTSPSPVGIESPIDQEVNIPSDVENDRILSPQVDLKPESEEFLFEKPVEIPTSPAFCEDQSVPVTNEFGYEAQKSPFDAANDFISNAQENINNLTENMENQFNIQPAIEQVCEFVESSVVENVKDIDEFLPDQTFDDKPQVFEEFNTPSHKFDDFMSSAQDEVPESQLAHQIEDMQVVQPAKDTFNSHQIDEMTIPNSFTEVPEPQNTIDVNTAVNYETNFITNLDNDSQDVFIPSQETQIQHETFESKQNEQITNEFEKINNDFEQINNELKQINNETGDDLGIAQKLSELTMNDEIKESAPEVISECLASPQAVMSPELISYISPEVIPEPVEVPNDIPAAEITAVAVAAAAVTATTAVVAAKKPTISKSKSAAPAATTKKTAVASKSAASPASKPAAAKPSSATTVKKTTTTTSAITKSSVAPISKVAPKPKTPVTSPTKPTTKPISAASKPAPKPMTATTRTSAVTDKKPLTNGDIKKEPIKKPIASAPRPITKPAVSSVTKTSAPSAARTSTTATRTTTVSARPAPAAKTAPRVTSTTTTTTTVTKTSRPVPSARAPVPKPAVIKSTTDKAVKDSTNKQISAARPTPAPRSAVAPKVSSAKTAVRTTTTVTTKTATSPIKKPAVGITKTAVSKVNSKTSTKVTGKTVPTEKQNGVDKSVKKMDGEICINGSPLITDIPLKDSSPQMDNSLLPIIDAAAD